MSRFQIQVHPRLFSSFRQGGLHRRYLLGAVAFMLLLSLTITWRAEGRQEATRYTADPNKAGDTLFIENAGQFHEQVRFQAQGENGVFHFTSRAIWLTLFDPINGETTDDEPQGVNLKLTFAGTDTAPRIVGFNPVATKVSFFKGQDPANWHADVPVYTGIRYEEVYPGIDIEFTSVRGHWQPRIVADAGANLAEVRWQVAGAMSQTLAADDSLQLETAVGPIELPAFRHATSTAELPLLEKETGLANTTLMAAPVITNTAALSYSTFFGGSGTGVDSFGQNEGVFDMEVDTSGNAYIVGSTYSTDLPSEPGAIPANAGDYDAFVAKVNPEGTDLLFVSYLGGPNGDSGNGIAVDEIGAAYVVGATGGNFPVKIGAYKTFCSFPCSDAYVAKFTPDGTMLIYATYLGSDDLGDRAYDVAVDQDGAAYITGDTVSKNFPTTAGAFQPEPPPDGVQDAWVSKLSPTGNYLVYSTYLAGKDTDSGHGIAVDQYGSAHVTGRTESDDFPLRNAAQDNCNPGLSFMCEHFADAFVTKLKPDGSDAVFSTYLGGDNRDNFGSLGAIAVAADGDIFVTGHTQSTNFYTSRGAFQKTPLSGAVASEAFVTQFDAGGSIVYSTFLGGTGMDHGSDIAADAITGYAYVTGVTHSTDFPMRNSFQNVLNGTNDVFVTILNHDGSDIVASTYLGGSDTESSRAIALNPNDLSIYVAGATASTDFPTKSGSADTTYNGGPQDGFVTHFGAPAPVTDLSPYALEVTQAVQDLNNSVLLVAGKRTFVRLYASSSNGYHDTFAQLRVRRGGEEIVLHPINGVAGHIVVRPKADVDRTNLDHTFLFELPTQFISDTVTLIGEVNPITAFRHRDPLETDYTNNEIIETVTFETVAPVSFVFYRLGYHYYDSGSLFYQPPPTSNVEFIDAVDLIQRMFPINDVIVHSYRTDSVIMPLDDKSNKLKNCFLINLALMSAKNFDARFDPVKYLNARYYGIADDVPLDIFKYGCAWYLPSGGVGSGPTNFADHAKFHAHELGHTFARFHVPSGPGCDPIAEPWDRLYPYPDSRISPTDVFTDPTALFGFDIGTKKVYTPSAPDNMSYCFPRSRDWISDYTYEGIKAYNDIFPPSAPLMLTSIDRLSVMGFISGTNQVFLQPLFVVPNAGDIEPQTPGNYAIVLRDDQGGELGRYPFTPDEVHAESGTAVLLITEWVPYVMGTTQVDIEGPAGLLTTVTAGTNEPGVTLTSPNGGEILSGNTISLTWTASDADGDPLSYMVQYSADNGATWKVVVANMTDTELVLDGSNLQGSTAALFRVWASDGIHTTTDESDTVFTVVNHEPTVVIVAPSQPTTIAAGQTLHLRADAYDIDLGVMDGTSLTWSSDLDGVFGNGRNFSTADLSIGAHIITLLADDTAGAAVTATIPVTIVADVSQLPLPADKLQVNPATMSFLPAAGAITTSLLIENQNIFNDIPWTVMAADNWVQMSPVSGTTPAQMLVIFNDTGFDVGTYTTTITFSSVISPNDQVVVTATVQITSPTSPTPTATPTGTSIPPTLTPTGTPIPPSPTATNTSMPPTFTPTPAAFDIRINYQPASALVPAGYLVDAGEIFANRGNGYSYGWDLDISSTARDRNHSSSPDQRYDTLIHSQHSSLANDAIWEIELPDGDYEVYLVAGDPSHYNGYYHILAEGVTIIDANPSNSTRWFANTAIVTVNDGRLTFTNGANADWNKFDFVHIRSVGVAPTATPTSTPIATATNTPLPTATSTATNTPLPSLTATPTSTSMPPSPTATSSPVPPTFTPTPAAFDIRINYQPASASVPAGYLVDAGRVFAHRGNGYSYGWDIDISSTARDRNHSSSPDQRYDTLLHTQHPNAGTPADRWEIALPNGTYQVRVVMGDPSYYDSVYKVDVEGVTVIDGTPSTNNRWFDNSVTIVVTDGRLTLTNGAGSSNNKVDFIEIHADTS